MSIPSCWVGPPRGGFAGVLGPGWARGEGVGFGITALGWGEGKLGVKERSWGKRAKNREGRANSWLQMGQNHRLWGKQRLFVSKYAPSSAEPLVVTWAVVGMVGPPWTSVATALALQMDHAFPRP